MNNDKLKKLLLNSIKSIGIVPMHIIKSG